jgi:lipocalin
MLDLQKYLGKWYELAHYPSWFQRNTHINTTAEYSLNSDRTINVHNSTIIPGIPPQSFDSYGKATYLGGMSFNVQFSMPEVAKLAMSGEFQPPQIQSTGPNYVIDHLWTDDHGGYIFAIVTDSQKNSLYVLSRDPHPCLEYYSKVMSYVMTHYDADRLVQVSHL